MEKDVNIKVVFPNMVTMMALAFGVSSINMSLWGNWSLAVLFIVLAAFFDFMDGKVARLLGVSSKFGAELDSLSDFVSFGVAPSLLMYQWTMDPGMRIQAMYNLAYKSQAIGVSWSIVLFLSMCCAARLARFNTLLDEKQPSYWTHFFMGVPAPAGGAIAILPLIMWLAFGKAPVFQNTYFVTCFMVFAGVMMASKIPTLSLKHMHIKKEYVSFLAILGFILIAALLTFPWITFSIVGILYILSIPVCIMCFMKMKQKEKVKENLLDLNETIAAELFDKKIFRIPDSKIFCS